jgi:two-component system sensor histidine kinase/response regulator
VTRHTLRKGRKSLKILLAEDNPVNQRLTKYIIAKQGHSVAIAENGREVLILLEKKHFDLVFMDIQMPEMDGLQTTEAIRRREKETGTHIPIIAMTAHAMKEDRQRCFDAGMDGYISKPINPHEIFEAIERIEVSVNING